MRSVIAIVAVAGMASSASAAIGQFFPSIDDGGGLISDSDTIAEARFKADLVNWDTRLEDNGFPANGDNQTNVSNSRSEFEGGTFGFDLSYSGMNEQLTWTITRPGGQNVALSLDTAGFESANTFQLFTVGNRGDLTLTGLQFAGLGKVVDNFPSLDTEQGVDTFERTFLFLGLGVNLLGADDWSLSGDIRFDNLSPNNPGENAKLTIKLERAIPAPGAAAMLGLAGLAATRRRR